MSSLAFYGDSQGAEVFAIDLDQMCLAARIPTGAGPYPVDLVGSTHVLASTRKEKSVTLIELATLQPLEKIALPHKPRSSTTHANGLILVSGADRPMTSIIDSRTWKVVRTVGVDITGDIHDFGGSLASGHEKWLPDGARFFLLDRVRRRICLYRATSGELMQEIETVTSCHHVVSDTDGTGRLYALCEGNQPSRIPPSVLVLAPDGEAFKAEAQAFLPILPAEQARMGGHHVDLHGGKLYAGSNEGATHVLDQTTLAPRAHFLSGPGNGHTGFVNDGGEVNVGITINHTAQHVTFFDPASDVASGDVPVSDRPSVDGKRTQGHTSGKRGRFFYMMASLDARFLEIDCATRAITRELCIPAADGSERRPYPMQGTFVWDAPAGGALCTQCC